MESAGDAGANLPKTQDRRLGLHLPKDAYHQGSSLAAQAWGHTEEIDKARNVKLATPWRPRTISRMTETHTQPSHNLTISPTGTTP